MAAAKFPHSVTVAGRKFPIEFVVDKAGGITCKCPSLGLEVIGGLKAETGEPSARSACMKMIQAIRVKLLGHPAPQVGKVGHCLLIVRGKQYECALNEVPGGRFVGECAALGIVTESRPSTLAARGLLIHRIVRSQKGIAEAKVEKPGPGAQSVEQRTVNVLGVPIETERWEKDGVFFERCAPPSAISAIGAGPTSQAARIQLTKRLRRIVITNGASKPRSTKDEREEALRAVDAGEPVLSVARRLGRSAQSIRDWMNMRRNGVEITGDDNGTKPATPPAVGADALESVKARLAALPPKPLHYLRGEIGALCERGYSLRDVADILNREGIEVEPNEILQTLRKRPGKNTDG